MNLADVMQQLSDRAATIAGLKCFPYPPDRITPPSFEVGLPEPVSFDDEYAAGSDVLTFPATVWVSRSQDRTAAAQVTEYVARLGPQSIKSVLESGVYTAMETVHVPSVEFITAPIAGVEYVGAQFTVEVTGSGGT